MTEVTDRAAVMAVLDEAAAANFTAMGDYLGHMLGRALSVQEVAECFAIGFGYGCGILSFGPPAEDIIGALNDLATATARKTASEIAATNCAGRA